MTLILLQPGDRTFLDGIGSDAGWTSDGTPLGDALRKLTAGAPAVQILSVAQGLAQPGPSTKPLITCTKNVDSSSVHFYDYCTRAIPIGQGRDQPSMLYLTYAPDGKSVNILTIAMRDALITSINLQTGDNAFTEQFTLTFAEVLWSHQDANGRQLFGWSYKTNGAIGQFTD